MNDWLTLDYADPRRIADRLTAALATSSEQSVLEHPFVDPALAVRQAAVLLPVRWRPRGLSIVLTKRPYFLRHHPGQISLPGGGAEAGDRSAWETATREANEEIGLLPNLVRPIGELSPLPTVSGYQVTPLVGWIEEPFRPEPNPQEVAAVFELPLPYLLNRDYLTHFRLQRRGLTADLPAITFREHFIWGATAHILYEFRTRLLNFAASRSSGIAVHNHD